MPEPGYYLNPNNLWAALQGAAGAGFGMMPGAAQQATPWLEQRHQQDFGSPSVPGAVGDALQAINLIPMGRTGIRAYHGSPHKFDKFSMDRIGTGEGAQAYGHGLYFAENEAVARAYKDQLARTNSPAILKADPNVNMSLLYKAQDAAKEIGGGMGMTPEAFKAEIIKNLRSHPEGTHTFDVGLRNGAADALERGHLSAHPMAKGHMYEVNINAKPEQFLDWDRPVQGQNEAIKKFIGPPSSLFPPEMTGAEMYRMIGRGAEPQVSSALREAGIPGIKYLDQGSRTQGQGTSNYVVFNDSIVDILKRYGLLGAPAGVAASQYDGN